MVPASGYANGSADGGTQPPREGEPDSDNDTPAKGSSRSMADGHLALASDELHAVPGAIDLGALSTDVLRPAPGFIVEFTSRAGPPAASPAQVNDRPS